MDEEPDENGDDQPDEEVAKLQNVVQSFNKAGAK